jgi:Ca2+-binding EF-hand superfamily protein
LEKKQIYDLYDIFTEEDKKRLAVLDFNEFVSLLRKIDKTLTKTECIKIFNAFDKDGDGKISFN